jgi:serine/threonine protein kinase
MYSYDICLQVMIALFIVVPVIVSSGILSAGVFIACVYRWKPDDDDEEEDDEIDVKKLPPIPSSIQMERLIYVVEKVVDTRLSGVQVVLARAATPVSKNSICFTVCEPYVIIKVVPRIIKRKKYQFDVQHEIVALQLTSEIPGVVDMIECVSDDYYTYIVMKYLSGGDLFSLVENTSGLNEEIVRGYFKSIVTTLKMMQEKCGLAHHDISLDNMMLDSTGAVCLIDLGMSIRIPGNAKLATSLIVPQLYGGKSSYMAPEIARMKPVVDVYAADVWSLGVCLYNLLTASPLYDKPFDATFCTIETKGGIKSILKMNEKRYGRHLSPQAKDILCMMLHHDPHKRPSFAKLLNHPFVTGVVGAGAIRVLSNDSMTTKVIQYMFRILSVASDFFSISI